MGKMKLTELERKWVLYDVANSAFVLLVSTILPILSEAMATAEGYTTNQATTVWSYIAAGTTLLFVVLGPVLGAFADMEGRKKRFFLFFLLLGCAGCALTGLMPRWILFIVCLAAAKIGLNGSLTFYDSMLTDITTDERMDNVSALGFAYGYIGSCVPFVAGLAFVLLCRDNLGLIPISLHTACLIALIICALWWFFFSTPLLGSYKQMYFVPARKHVVRDTFSHLGRTIKKILGDRSLVFFLLAYFFYIDGVHTIIEIATPYGQSMGITTTNLLLALLMTQVIAFPCAIIFGRLSARIQTRRLLQLAILFYVGVAVFAYFLTHNWQFWVLAAAVGMVQGGIQALSRSYWAKIIPKENSSEYFGFFDIFGKSASVLGTFLMGLIIQRTNRPNLGVIPIAIMLVLGFVIITVMPKTAADTIPSK